MKSEGGVEKVAGIVFHAVAASRVRQMPRQRFAAREHPIWGVKSGLDFLIVALRGFADIFFQKCIRLGEIPAYLRNRNFKDV